MIGEHIEHYRIVERLGEGGMGTVYRAVDTLLEREVALKVLRTDLSDEPNVTQRFRAEAVALARLSHPNIATLYGLVRRESHLCMVMEFVRGDTLTQLMRRDKRFDAPRAVRITTQILAALDYAHGMGIVHRDVKPSNVIVNANGFAKVLDFGIARVLDSDRMTRQGFVVGTPQYMAPEQIRGEDVDGRADVYATGVLLYEMLAGRLPFASDSGVGLMYAHLEGAVTPLPDVAPDVPHWLYGAIRRAMARSPENRLRAAELRTLLEDGLAGRVQEEPATGATRVLGTGNLAMRAGASQRAGAAPGGDAARRESGAEPPAPQPPAPSPQSPAPSPQSPADLPLREPQAHTGEVTSRRSRTGLAAAALIAAVAAAAVMMWLRQGTPPATQEAGLQPIATAAAAPEPPDAPRAGDPSAPTAARPAGDAAQVAGPPASREPSARQARSEPRVSDTPPPAPPAPPEKQPPPRPESASTAAREAPARDTAPRESPAPPVKADAAGEGARPIPAAAAAPAPEPATPAPAPAPLPPASFDDQVMLIPADRGYEEVEVRVTVHPERMVVFDLDRGRVARQVFYRKGDLVPTGQLLVAQPRLLTGSERWFIVPTNIGELVLRLDLDSTGAIVPAFEARSGLKVARIIGELKR